MRGGRPPRGVLDRFVAGHPRNERLREVQIGSFRPIVGRLTLAQQFPLADVAAMQEDARLAAETATMRLILIGEANGMWHFVDESEHEGDKYTARYFAPMHFSWLYESADAAERDAGAMLPWLRNG